MEKEINIEAEQFFVNFFYEGFNFTETQISEYKNSLQFMAEAFSVFSRSELKLQDFSLNLNITICDDETIKDLNRNHRNKDKVTDVLSFPLQESIRSGDFDKFSPEIELGDLYICESICTEQATEFKLSFQEEFIHLSTHGFLHLSGYDHEISVEEEKIMEKFEEKIIKNISKIKNQ
ncbi:MAG: putative rRNA maturation factor [Bacteriovoracaceae bacterium]|jgi:probable rRNA maturation factor